jgi:hypothetical protein
MALKNSIKVRTHKNISCSGSQFCYSLCLCKGWVNSNIINIALKKLIKRWFGGNMDYAGYCDIKDVVTTDEMNFISTSVLESYRWHGRRQSHVWMKLLHTQCRYQILSNAVTRRHAENIQLLEFVHKSWIINFVVLCMCPMCRIHSLTTLSESIFEVAISLNNPVSPDKTKFEQEQSSRISSEELNLSRPGNTSPYFPPCFKQKTPINSYKL